MVTRNQIVVCHVVKTFMSCFMSLLSKKSPELTMINPIRLQTNLKPKAVIYKNELELKIMQCA